MTPHAEYITVHLGDGTVVRIHGDGSVSVDLAPITAARHQLLGSVVFGRDDVIISSSVKDAFTGIPLRPYVIRAAENAARIRARHARAVARRIIGSKHGAGGKCLH